MILVDTNVIIDLLQDDPDWSEWSLTQLRSHAQIHELAINPIIYSELSLAFETSEQLDDIVDALSLLVLEIPRAALFLAGKAFVRYRKHDGPKTNVLPDFFIGAHAAVSRTAVLTRDRRRYSNYFPTVNLITPG